MSTEYVLDGDWSDAPLDLDVALVPVDTRLLIGPVAVDCGHLRAQQVLTHNHQPTQPAVTGKRAVHVQMLRVSHACG